jgi:hypothetical protein
MLKPMQHLLVAALTAVALPVLGQTSPRPNIVLILADDLGYGRNTGSGRNLQRALSITLHQASFW